MRTVDIPQRKHGKAYTAKRVPLIVTKPQGIRKPGKVTLYQTRTAQKILTTVNAVNVALAKKEKAEHRWHNEGWRELTAQEFQIYTDAYAATGKYPDFIDLNELHYKNRAQIDTQNEANARAAKEAAELRAQNAQLLARLEALEAKTNANTQKPEPETPEAITVDNANISQLREMAASAGIPEEEYLGKRKAELKELLTQYA